MHSPNANGKRSCPSSADGEPNADSKASLAEVEALLGGLEQRISANCSNEIKATVKQLHKIVIDRINLVENKITTHASLLETLGASVKALQQENDVIKKRLGLAESSKDAAPPLSDDWERPARGNILTIGTSLHVPKEILRGTIKEWLAPREFAEGDWRLDGPAHGRNFTLVFNGLPFFANKNALQSNLSLRDSKGVWKQLQTQDAEGEMADIYISKDQMPKHKRETVLGKRLLKALEKDFGENRGLVFQRNSRTIAHKGKVLAKVVANTYEDISVHWVMDLVDKLKINKDEVLEQFNSRVGSAPNVTWST